MQLAGGYQVVSVCQWRRQVHVRTAIPLRRYRNYLLVTVLLSLLERAAGFRRGTGHLVCRLLPIPDSLLDFRITFGGLGHGRETVLHPLLVGIPGLRLRASLRATWARRSGDLLHFRVLRHGFDPLPLRVR